MTRWMDTMIFYTVHKGISYRGDPVETTAVIGMLLSVCAVVGALSSVRCRRCVVAREVQSIHGSATPDKLSVVEALHTVSRSCRGLLCVA